MFSFTVDIELIFNLMLITSFISKYGDYGLITNRFDYNLLTSGKITFVKCSRQHSFCYSYMYVLTK